MGILKVLLILGLMAASVTLAAVAFQPGPIGEPVAKPLARELPPHIAGDPKVLILIEVPTGKRYSADEYTRKLTGYPFLSPPKVEWIEARW